MQTLPFILSFEHQAFESLYRAGLPVSKSQFPDRYHNEALLHSYPAFAAPTGAIHATIHAAINKAYTGQEQEASRAKIAGALIHLMYTYPVQFLTALHNPEVRSIVEEATIVDWDSHINTLCNVIKNTSEVTA